MEYFFKLQIIVYEFAKKEKNTFHINLKDNEV